jgi:hypothetical protein
MLVTTNLDGDGGPPTGRAKAFNVSDELVKIELVLLKSSAKGLQVRLVLLKSSAKGLQVSGERV